MSNIITTNPLQLDTSGAVITAGGAKSPLWVHSIGVIAAAEAWEVKLTDANNGNVLFWLKPTLASADFGPSIYRLARPIRLDSLYWQTKTQITMLLLYCEDGGRPS